MPATDAEVTLREITAETVNAILKLEVSETQKGFVAPNAVSIAQAYFYEQAWFRAIYAGETPVGFVMLYLDPEEPFFGVWRLMVDAAHQGKGYGREAVRQVIALVRGMPGAEDLRVSYVPGEGDPSAFYAELGFMETGEWEGKEKVMVLSL